MNRLPRVRSLLIAALFLGASSAPGGAGADVAVRRGPTERLPGRRPAVGTPLDSFPVSFERNLGQASRGASHLARGPGWVAALDAGGASFRPSSGRIDDVVAMRLRGAREDVEFEGLEPLRTRSNYFLGDDPARWVAGVPHFGSLRAASILPGISIRWLGLRGGRIRYDFECEPGADPSVIALEFRGASSVVATPDGSLVVESAAGTLRHSAPVAWQERAGLRRSVRCAFIVGDGSVGFLLEGHDPSLPLVIDPTVEYSAALGGGSAQVHACEMDEVGGVIVAGRTFADIATTSGAFQASRAGSDDVFVCRYQPGSANIDWLTYVGGQFDDRCFGLDVDPEGFVYLTGYTQSTNFPLKGPFQSTMGGTAGAFVTKLAPDGASLEYSTYLGGGAHESGEGIAVDASGRAWVCGWTQSSDFPRVDSVDSTYSGTEGFITCMTAQGNGIVCSTFLGGSTVDFLWDLALALDGTVWVCGETNSTDLPTASPVQSSNAGGVADFLIASLSADGKSLRFCSYLGGSGEDRAYGIDVDSSGDPVVGGYTVSTNFPTTAPLQSSNGGGVGGFDAVLCRLDGTANTIEFATYFGGSASEVGNAVAVDSDGSILLAGKTRSSDLDLADPVDGTYAGGDDIFVARFSADGSSLQFSTYFGGTTNEEARSVATDGAIVVAAGEFVNPSTNSFEGRVVGLRFLPDPYRRFRVESATGRAVHLMWTDPHAGAYGAEVQRAAGTGAFTGLADLADGATEHEDDTVAELATYRYRVRGTSGSGNTAWTRAVLVRIPPRSVEDLAPTVLPDGSVRLDWTDASSLESGYSVLRRTGGAGPFTPIATLPPGSTTWIDGTVAAETVYQYAVRTLTASGAQADSPPVDATTPPRAPGNFSVQALDDVSVSLSWQDLSAVETGYEIHRRDDGSGGPFATSTTTGPGVTLRLESGLASGNAYTWRVRTLGALANSPWSSEVSLVTPPAPPSNVTAEAIDAENARVRWVDGSTGESGFRIESRRSGAAAFVTAALAGIDGTEAVVPGLVQKQRFEFRVRSVGPSGASRAMETVSLDLPGQIVIESARRVAAKGKRPARLTVSGRLDTGPAAGALPMDADLRIGESEFEPTGAPGPRGSVRYEQDGLRLDLVPSRAGSSAVSLRLSLEGAAAESVDPEGEFLLFLAFGEYEGAGRVRLQGGRFDAKKDIGDRPTPSMALGSLKAKLGEAGRHSIAVKGAFRPYETVPTTAPNLRIEIGSAPPITLDGAEFTERKGRFLLKAKGPPDWKVTVDPLRGTLSLKGSRLDLGEFPAGAAPVRVVVVVGDRRFEDEPVLVSSGEALKY